MGTSRPRRRASSTEVVRVSGALHSTGVIPQECTHPQGGIEAGGWEKYNLPRGSVCGCQRFVDWWRDERVVFEDGDA